MYTGKLVFSQVMDFMPMHTFRRCVTRYQGDYKVKKFTCLDQYLCMAFAQITYRESLRDIEICLRAQEPKLYHMGIRDKVSRSTIADANEQRNWKIYADLAYSLINTARKLYSDEPFAVELEQTAYALDATTIDFSACPCFRGPGSDRTKELSNCIPYWICVAASQLSFISPTANSTKSIRSTLFPSSQGRFTLWIAAIWTSPDYTTSRRLPPSF
jgi:hypothetical protein